MKDLVTRRQVLELAVAGAAASALAGCGDAPGVDGAAAGATGGPTGATGGATGSGGGGGGATGSGGAGAGTTGATASTATGEMCVAPAPSCEETLENPLGPYHRPGAPFATTLPNPSMMGEPLSISGVVYAADCVTPLAGAVVEVWQADSEGNYDNEAGDPGPDVWVLRASIETDACGRYAYDSIMPGRYLNGAQYRPAHIHYRVTHPDIAPFVTQLYFVGDPYNDIDSMFEPELAIDLVDRGGTLVGVFDVFLTPA